MHDWQFTLIMAGITWLMAGNLKAEGELNWAGGVYWLALFQVIYAVVLFFVEKA